MQPPKITTIKEKKLHGLSVQTTLAEHKTKVLWNNFRIMVPQIKNRKGTDFYGVQQYTKPFVPGSFTPLTLFTKWAAVEVEDFAHSPKDNQLLIPAGRYAVFLYKGTPENFHGTVQYIFGEWLPKSEYNLDARPHFEILPENYSPVDPNAEEEVWIPVYK